MAKRKSKKQFTKRRKLRGADEYMPAGLEAVAFMGEWAARVNKDVADDLAARLQRHRQGGRKGIRVSRALLLRAIRGVTDALRARLRTEPKQGAVYKEVGKHFDRSASWVRQQLHADEKE